MRRERLEAAMPWFVTIGLLVLWEGSCRAFDIPEFVLPRPTRVTEVLIDNIGAIWFHASHTLYTTLFGFVLAIAFGVLLGIFVGSSRLVYKGVYPEIGRASCRERV